MDLNTSVLTEVYPETLRNTSLYILAAIIDKQLFTYFVGILLINLFVFYNLHPQNTIIILVID